MERKYKFHGINYNDFPKILRENFRSKSDFIELPVWDAIGERLYEDIYSSIDLPRKNMAFYDGYAVRHNDISGASPDNPIKLKIVGEIYRNGDDEGIIIGPGETAYVSANSPLPSGADTVLRSELVGREGKHVFVRKELEKGSDIVYKGEDLRKGNLVLRRGKLIEGQDVTLITELGYARIKVFRKPQVAIFSVGDELKDKLKEGTIFPDNYAFTISYMVKEMGCKANYLGILSDDPGEIASKVENAVDSYDAILLIGGASIGLNDKTGPALMRIGKPIFHGTTLSPGKVSGIYVIKDKPVFLVPGHIGSAVACLYYIFYPYIKYVYYDDIDTVPHIRGMLKVEPDQRPGKHIVRTVLIELSEDGRCLITPQARRLGGSTLITLFTEAAGLVMFEPNKKYKAGDRVEVRLFSRSSVFKII